ncbi:MAG TPA: DUF899 domain-containing protein [Lacunisphaera sp.]|nr:DUF899 domain-containing protein [Lacunisphaera sp.]
MKTKSSPIPPKVATPEKWLAARRELLREEKEHFRSHDKLKARRRALPWVKVGKRYTFASPGGQQSLADLFAGKSQLLVYHFMFDPTEDEGCAHCSFWADHFDSLAPHLGQRDTTFVAVSRAPLKKIRAFQKRMGWKFKWVSSGNGDFNYDFHVSFTPEQIRSGTATYNYAPVPPEMEDMSDREGASAFYRDKSGTVYHTYSTYARGIDLLNNTYNFLDLTAKGRAEDPEATQDWVRHHDRYEHASAAR